MMAKAALDLESNFRQIVAERIAQNLTQTLKDKGKAHRASVTDLPASLMQDVASRVRTLAPQVETYILADNPHSPLEISATKLIERRNVSDNVVLALIPSRLKTGAEDSYGEHTFEKLSVMDALYDLRRDLIEQVSKDFPFIERIVNSPYSRRQPIENALRYLLAVRQDRKKADAPGRYLYFLNLVPDLGLVPDQVENRIDRNSQKVETLTQPDKPLLAKIEALELKADSVQSELFRRLRESEGTDPAMWLPLTLEWGITFDKWPEADAVSPDQPIKVTFDPLGKFKGMQEEDEDFVAYATTPINVGWQLSPPNSEHVRYYLLTLLRQDRADEDLLPPKRIAANKRKAKLDLKNVELDDEGRVPARLEIRAIGHDDLTLDSDTSDPFWVEKDTSGTRGDEDAEEDTRRNPNGDEVHSIAEALLIAALRARERSNRKVELSIRHDRSGWASSFRVKGAVTDIYRIRLASNDLFHIKFVPLLRDLERTILDEPADLRSFSVELSRSRRPQQLTTEGSPVVLSEKQASKFLRARSDLFKKIAEVPGALIELADLQPLADLVLDYAKSYLELVEDPSAYAKIIHLDTLQIQIPAGQILLLAPTHPLRLLWLLQYQRLLGKWTDDILGAKSDEVAELFDRDSIDLITSRNTPAFLATSSDRIWVNTDNINLFWSIFLPAPVEQSREALSFLYRALNIQTTKADVSSLHAERLADQIAFYLDQHPYIRTLNLNVLNPGDALMILDTLRKLQREPDYESLNYDLRFLGNGSFDQIGAAFDDLMNQTDEQRGQDVDDAFLVASSNPLLPKLTFAKHRPLALLDSSHSAFDAHLTVLLDHFRSTVHTTPIHVSGGSTSLHGLLTEFRSNYRSDSGILWSRSIQPNRSTGLDEDDDVEPLLFDLQMRLLQAVSVQMGKSNNHVPAIQVLLGPEDQQLIGRIHDISDWVLTVDRNFGVEYFDNPEPVSAYKESYLIDYRPEFLNDVGHRLIVSTERLGEIETLLARSLKNLGLLSENIRPIDMLNALRALSGRIALNVLSEPTSSEQLIGLGLAQILLRNHGRLADQVLVPAQNHPDLFGEDASNTLALVSFEKMILRIHLLTVRFSKGTFVGDEYTAREDLREEIQRVSEHIHSQYASSEAEHLDQFLRNKAWENVLDFYFNRALRYGFVADNSPACQVFRNGLNALRRGDVDVDVSLEGLVFNLRGSSKPEEEYHGVSLRIVGNEDLLNLKRGAVPESATNAHEHKPIDTLPERKPSAKVETVPASQSDTQQHAGKGLEIELGSGSGVDRPVMWAPQRPYPKQLTNQHILIVGKSGSGKTQTITALIYELSRAGVPSLIFDFHGEYSDRSSAPFRKETKATAIDAAQGIPINPLTVPLDPITGQPTDYRNVVYQVTESLADIFGLGDIQKRFLKRAVDSAYKNAGFSRNSTTWSHPAPVFASIWDELKAIEEEEKKTTRNLVARLEPLFESEVFQGGGETFDDLLRTTTVIRLSSLANKELRMAISRFFLQKVYERMLALGPSEQQRLFCVIDEAHRLTHDPTVTDLIKEARKYGVGLILSSQETRDFDRSVFANTGTLIVLQLEIEDARIMAENLGLVQSNERAATVEIILRQKPGQALVHNNHYQPYTQVQIIPFGKRIQPSP